VKLSEWMIALAATVALLASWRTGLFDATRQNLSAQQERLTVEKSQLTVVPLPAPDRRPVACGLGSARHPLPFGPHQAVDQRLVVQGLEP
jgi:hypothetical protein